MLNKTDKSNKSMLRPLKDRFILLEILSAVAIVLSIYFIIEIVITISFNSHVDDGLMDYVNTRNLDNIWMSPSHPLKRNVPDSDEQDVTSNFTVGIVADTNGKIEAYYLGSYAMTDNQVQEIVRRCISNGTIYGYLDDYKFKYCIIRQDPFYRIALFDMSVFLHYKFIFNILMIIIGLSVTVIVAIISSAEVNWLMRPLDESLTKQKQFTSDASHEFKTPLTVIKANVNILKEHPERTVGEQMKWINYIDDESSKMKELIQDMLYLAKTDAVRDENTNEPLCLSDLLFEVYLPFESLAFENGININADIEDSLCVKGEANMLKRLISTLLENALKYAGDGGTVIMRAYLESNRAIVTINNTGDPIPKEKLKHLFERFYRVDESRNGKSGGFGLGLAIAKNIADKHNAILEVTSDEVSGTTFRLEFQTCEGQNQ